jgi:hypothetical protein
MTRRRGDWANAVPLSSRPRLTGPARFTLICAGLLVIDFVIGAISFGHCLDAGDACSTANEWIDTVTFGIGGLLIVLVVCGSLLEVIQRYRA